MGEGAWVALGYGGGGVEGWGATSMFRRVSDGWGGVPVMGGWGASDGWVVGGRGQRPPRRGEVLTCSIFLHSRLLTGCF